MGRGLHKLTALGVAKASFGKHSDGGGLWLHKRKDGGAQWVLRTTVFGRRREMGLGSAKLVSLKEAREEADKWRAVARQGKDPITERNRLKREATRNFKLLEDVANDAFEARKAELKDDGEAGKWFSPLANHVLTKLGKVPVSEIDQVMIRDVLKPIWHTKASTAEKAIDRLGICLRHAAALELSVDVQAVAKAKALLGKQKHEVKHIPALHWSEVPSFYNSLNDGTPTQLALRLLILTAVRSTPIRFMRLEEVEGNIWTIPAQKMKGKKNKVEDFRVPLSQEASRVIEEAKPFARGGYLFPSPRKGVLSDATMAGLMKRRGLDARPHGFRSSFRDWCAEQTDTPEQIAETALAHSVGTPTSRAYRRTDYLAQRRVLMNRWAEFLTTKNT